MIYHSTAERSEQIARFIIDNEETVRGAANVFGISKSTVHKDITGPLYYTNRALFEEVKKVLDRNKSERHLRGGEATRQKYLHKRSYDA